MYAARFCLVVTVLSVGLSGCAGDGEKRSGSTVDPSGKPSLGHAVAGLKDPPYSPDSGLSPDAVRIIDVMSIQASLLQYRLAEGLYPESLSALFPKYAAAGVAGPSRPPTDPETGHAYHYAPLAGGREYEIAASLSNGRRFEGFPHRTPA